MYSYFFELTPAKPHSTINYCADDIRQKLLDAAETVNRGYTFRTDGKSVTITDIQPKKIKLTLQCKTALRHSARSLSAITRYLTANCADFQEEVYNRTLFHMDLVSQKSSFDGNPDNISDAELVKAVVDLLFAGTTETKMEADLRVETIRAMKELIKPFLP